ncbi:hypothetical protein [Apilactobacillus micheneri]|uniref:hypothetical protein n=1 Tax=Apilactobacillus micheneri TaxID=1899430 RepID=UPI000D0469B2|nr:hypothetical protein [Apilactobacillus micheneri]TPR35115.1 hypothetical protein DY116_06330 [Apilactobacillus micheneri]TPR38585.1 hypothetical protein DY119_06365 [Apilactobacillus micheneri]
MFLGAKNKININQKLNNIFVNYKNRNYNNVNVLNINDMQIYLAGIKYEDLPNYNVPLYLLNIECIDRDSKIVYGDISKDFAHRRVEPSNINKNNNTGSMISSQIAIDPLRQIVAITRGNNSISQQNIKRFLKNLLETNAMSFNLILNRKAMKDIANYDLVTKLDYSIASPSNFENIDEQDEDLINQFKYANNLQSDFVTTTFRTHLSNKDSILEKVSGLLGIHSKKAKVRKLNVSGMKDGKEDSIDLIKNSLYYNGSIHYDDSIEIEDIFNLLIYSFQQNYDFIQKSYLIENNLD